MNVADAAPAATVPDTAVPNDGVNVTVPPLTVPAPLVTAAVSVTVCDAVENVAFTSPATVVVAA